MVFKEKETLKNKSFVDQLKKERIQCLFEVINDIQQKERPRTIIKTPVKANIIKNIGLDTKNQNLKSIRSTNFTNSTSATRSIESTGVTGSTGATSLTNFFEHIDAIGFIKNIEPTKNYWFWKISLNNC